MAAIQGTRAQLTHFTIGFKLARVAIGTVVKIPTRGTLFFGVVRSRPSILDKNRGDCPVRVLARPIAG